MKPLLVGEQNPYGGDPYYALYPAPEGCSGHRLCCLILGMRREDYLRVFDRVNLCDGPWSMRQARKQANELRTRRGPLILLGSKVATAFGYKFTPFATDCDFDDPRATTIILPHPSGINRLWNRADSVSRARTLVAGVVPGIAHLLGAIEQC